MRRFSYMFFALAVFFLALVYAFLFLQSRPNAQALAREIVDSCEKDSGAGPCYEHKVPDLYPSHTIPEVFEIVRNIRRLDPSYQFCHVLAHKLGEKAVARDPGKWFDLIPLNPSDGLCSNGFIHGVIVGRFRNDVLDEATLQNTIPDFARACEPRSDWSPSPLDRAICYHGLGHLFMFITNANIRRSLDVCATVAQSPSGDFIKVCREGVFMQIYQPLEPDDFELVELLPEKPSRENYRRLCAAYDLDEEEGACLREAWPLFRDELLSGRGEAFCAGEPSATQEDFCYESVSTIIGRQLLGQDERVAKACSGLPDARQNTCFIAAAQAFLEEDRGSGERALELCGESPDADGCLATLSSRVSWIFGSDERSMRHFCNMLPEAHRASCGKR